ncbi:MAG: glutathione S-transferase family protein [Alphaproteobacteria bacterium]|nr:glutathione S-transferase family protein [Alphaproteobacteria bacterium]
MSKLKLYGYNRSRAIRTIWLLEELGLPYEQFDTGAQPGSTRTADYLKINPAGHVPAIDDDGFKLSESMAINLYLAKKHGKLYPADPRAEAKALQWSFWAMSELDKPIVQWILNTMIFPVEQRSARVALAAREEMEWPLQVLDGELKGRQYLADPNAFTVADLNVASVLYRLLFVDLAGKPNLEAWLKRCWDRPAAKTARAMREG